MDPFKLQTLGAVFANECLRRQKNKKKKKKAFCALVHTKKNMYRCERSLDRVCSLWSLVFVWGTKPRRSLASALRQRTKECLAMRSGNFPIALIG